MEPKQPTNINSYDIRIDEAINASNVVFGVFDRSLYSVDVPSSLPGLAVGETGGRHDSFPAYAWAVGYTHVFTPTFTNDMHVGMVHSDKLQRSVYGNTFGIPASFGIPGIPQVAENGGIPPINFSCEMHEQPTLAGVAEHPVPRRVATGIWYQSRLRIVRYRRHSCRSPGRHLCASSGTRALLGNSNGAVDAVLGGWGTYLIYTFQSGQPFTVGCPSSTSNFGCNAFTVPGQDLYSGPHNKTQWLNPAAFTIPPAATSIGEQDFSPLDGGPQQARGPHFNDLDASLFKNFHIYESTGLEFRLEEFNATNTPQFGQPSNLTGFNQFKPGNPGGFAAITSTRNDQRQVQAALKLTF